MKPTLTLLLLFIGYFIAAQDFDGARPVGSSSYGVNLGFQYNTKYSIHNTYLEWESMQYYSIPMQVKIWLMEV